MAQKALEFDVVAAFGDESGGVTTIEGRGTAQGRTVGLLQVLTCSYGEAGAGDRPGAKVGPSSA